LRRRADRLSELAWQRLLIGLELGDVNQQIALTWIAAQDLCRLYQCRSRYDAEQHLHRWLTTAPTPPSPSCTAWPASSTAGAPNCSPTSTPAAYRTGQPKPSMRLSRRSSESDTDTATSTTTDSASYFTAESTGKLNNQHESEADYHA
jgi:hypothetical protein